MHKQTDPASAATELLKRRSIRNSLAEWGRHKGFEPAPHHQLFISEIESFLKSEDEVLLLFAPPGSAKSTYVSVLLPSWYLAGNPTHSILAATHNVEFAERWGRRVRNDIAADANVLGISLSEDSKAAARWSLTSGGEYYGVGAGVGISGFRANLGVGDDLFGSREDAYSDTVREKRWNWYVDDFSARLKPGAKRILMNTRWPQEDVAGRVLEQIERNEIKGRVISIPAIAEANDPLGRKLGEYLWDGDKAVRAQSIRGRMALEGLYVPTWPSWYSEFKSELLSFPAGKHDDQVDALGLIGQLLDQMVPGQAPKKPEPPKPYSGYRPISLPERPNDWLCY